MTIATNMAGRGTDILLGGNPDMAAAEVGTKDPAEPNSRPRSRNTSSSARPSAKKCSRPAACTSSAPSATSRAASTTSSAAVRAPGRPGLVAVLPLARRRSDAHLRLRPHQGPDGPHRHGGGRAHRAPLDSRAIENAQKKVEAHNFDIRKHLLEYDDVMNKQREVVYHRRASCSAAPRSRTTCSNGRRVDRGIRRRARKRRD